MRYRPLGQSGLLADAAHLAARNGHTSFISAQNHWSLLERQAEAEVVQAARHFGLGVLPYFPLANGLLTGKVRQGRAIPAGTRLAASQGYVTDEKLTKVEALISWAQAHGVTILEVAVGALAAQPSWPRSTPSSRRPRHSQGQPPPRALASSAAAPRPSQLSGRPAP
jgi:aryl-alcohol dehydrogenase-like predicted oxidoreductase